LAMAAGKGGRPVDKSSGNVMKLDPPAVALIAPARVPPANSTATPQISMQPNLAVKPRMRLANMFWLKFDAVQT